MKKRLKSLGVPTLVLLALAVVLLGGGMVGSTRAALNYYSSVYKSEIKLPKIGVELYENGTLVGERTYTGDGISNQTAENYNDADDIGWVVKGEGLLKSLQPVSQDDTAGSGFEIGQKYTEELTVKNSGTIPIFVRVSVYRYWTEKDAGGNDVKVQALDPGYIELDWNLEDSGWVEDETASTEERTVLYYTKELSAEGVGAETAPFTSAFWISEGVKNNSVKVVETAPDGTTTFTTTYTYGGKQFHLEAVAEAVQAENGQDAVVSSWGVRNVEISGDSLKVYDTDVITHTDDPETDEPEGDVTGNDVSGDDVSGNSVSENDVTTNNVSENNISEGNDSEKESSGTVKIS